MFTDLFLKERNLKAFGGQGNGDDQNGLLQAISYAHYKAVNEREFHERLSVWFFSH